MQREMQRENITVNAIEVRPFNARITPAAVGRKVEAVAHHPTVAKRPQFCSFGNLLAVAPNSSEAASKQLSLVRSGVILALLVIRALSLSPAGKRRSHVAARRDSDSATAHSE